MEADCFPKYTRHFTRKVHFRKKTDVAVKEGGKNFSFMAKTRSYTGFRPENA